MIRTRGPLCPVMLGAVAALALWSTTALAADPLKLEATYGDGVNPFHLAVLGPPAEVIAADSLRLLYGVDVEVATRTAAERRVCVPIFAAEADG